MGMKLAIGPLLFDWGKRGFSDFYRRMAHETEADILYLGEVVCSKRATPDPEELAALADELKGCGKELVFSTLGLVMTEGEMETIRRLFTLAGERGILVEANDLAAMGIGDGHPLVAGPHLTTYNPETLDFLVSVGARRVVLPVELAGTVVGGIVGQRTAREAQIELFAHGKLPLTFSARCYTARAYHLPKVNCQYKCELHPDGMEVKTQEGQPFLTLNGIQTMSDRPFTLIDRVEEVAAMGVDVVRLSPQSRGMVELTALWKARLAGELDGAEALARARELPGGEGGFCNGYWLGKAGLDFADAPMLQAEQLG